jgi:tetratricopeptide (TPR) repeat protein
MRNPALTLMMTLLVLACAAAARAADPGVVAAARRALQMAVNRGELEPLMKARARFQALSSAEPGSALLHHWVAVATWRTVPVLQAKDRAQAERLCQDGLEHCEAALKIDRNLAGVHAIKAALEGLMVRFRPGEMMTLGMKIEEDFARAHELDPKDPRAWLLEGINTLHKPEPFGGGPVAAMERFRKAESLFAAAPPPDSTCHDWGYDDTLLWMGRAALAQKDSTTAESLYVKALQVNPANGWVSHILLPRLREARGGKGKP